MNGWVPEQKVEAEDFLSRLWTSPSELLGWKWLHRSRRRARRGSAAPHEFTDLTPTVPDS